MGSQGTLRAHLEWDKKGFQGKFELCQLDRSAAPRDPSKFHYLAD